MHCMSDQYLVQELAMEYGEESEEGNMCQAIRELMEDAGNEGIGSELKGQDLIYH